MRHFKLLKLAALAFVVSAALPSCGGKKSLKDSKASNVTGWEYNSKENGGFQVVTGYEQDTPVGMTFIQGGTFNMGRVIEDVISDWNNIPRRVTVASFYMDQYEICNVNWREYMHWMSIMFHNTPGIIEKCAPDTLVWREELAYNEPYLEYYFSHVSYNYYPVVGVSWEQASDYCLWRSDRVNERRMVENGVIQYPDFQAMKGNTDVDDIRNNQVFNTDKYIAKADYKPTEGKKGMKDVYGNARKTNMSDGILLPKFRLPTEAEWEYAAYGTKAIEAEENYEQKKIYPWYGHQMRNPDKKFRGEMNANYVRGRGDYMGMGGKLNDKATITAPVDAFWPNEFGLYNMAGNVNEWVLDVYRPLTSDDEQEYNPFRGNMYVKMAIDSSNTVDSEGHEQRVPQIDSLGRVVFKIEADKSDFANYAKLDVRNFKDGDPGSQLSNWKERSVDVDASTANMYDPEKTGISMLVTKISNTCRVYKGGSWKDRAYWLNPGQRRFLEQTESRSDIGFRCAMSKVGPEDEDR
ncbi:MAG: SUMF1/EgtB/PvdO family nonheme iron enzyme [Paludibacteraceae bacterium]|nr:SUMF1/EgtB/PvdO family nonheme iron enzyme [Candidatus Physcocola equi]MCQ2234695.1 SUMF1/EgtB/PvdO family nonheme iron enzyme [Paludibacteraceae bacterium]